MNLRHLGSMMLAAPAVLLALAGPAPTHAAETTITDPLTGTTVATRRNGGELTPQGWKVTSKGTGIGQYLYYLLPVGVTSGVLTFEAMGFKFDKYPSNGGETEEREHMLGVLTRTSRTTRRPIRSASSSASTTTRTFPGPSTPARTACASTAPPSSASATPRPRSSGARLAGTSSRSNGTRPWSAGIRTTSSSAASPSSDQEEGQNPARRPRSSVPPSLSRLRLPRPLLPAAERHLSQREDRRAVGGPSRATRRPTCRLPQEQRLAAPARRAGGGPPRACAHAVTGAGVFWVYQCAGWGSEPCTCSCSRAASRVSCSTG